jgi:hypothetical protein
MVTPPATVRNVALWRKQCRKIRALAQRIIDAKIGLIEGSLQMIGYQYALHASEDDDFAIFHSVSHDSTDLPISPSVRDKWLPEALEKKDEKIREVEERYHSEVVAAAFRIREKYWPE